MRAIDPKYRIMEDGDIVNLAGVPIPEDEPLILFRARDWHALRMLRYYRTLCAADDCTDFQLAGIDNRISAFSMFEQQHPGRMKQPGITRGK